MGGALASGTSQVIANASEGEEIKVSGMGKAMIVGALAGSAG